MEFEPCTDRECRMPRPHAHPATQWIDRTKCAFKAEMKMKGHSYKTLSRALANIGVTESPESIANRISAGTFSAWKLMQYLTAMGTRHFQITP